MENKFNQLKEYLPLIIVAVVLLVIIFFVVQPLIWSEDYADWVFYVRLFLALMAVQVFALLRLYNAILQNTRFLVRLREAMLKLVNSSPALERAMKGLSNALSSGKNSTEKLRETLERTTKK